MSYEIGIPTEEIKQLQISLRKQANLSWYSNDDRFTHPHLPTLPSISDTISQLDPSPPHLRCKVCTATLLRGSHSSICVFCGTHPHTTVLHSPPDPIRFKDTFGYRWLLQSLNLHGSEMVAPMGEENASNRRKSEAKDEIPLSELLDLEIRWPSEAEGAPQSGNSDSAASLGKSLLNLAGVDLGSFFDRRESDVDSFQQNSGSGREISTASGNAFQAEENLSLFQNFQAPETASGSAKDQKGDLFSGWDANFKSAGPVQEESKSFDRSKVDFDTVSGSWTGSFGAKKNDEFNPSASMGNDWFQADGWRTSNSEVPSQTGKSELTMNISGTKTAESGSVSSIRNSDWMHDQLQGNDNKATGTMASDEADDSFDDAWNEFTGSASAQDSSNINSSSKITGQIGKSENTADLDQWQGSNNRATDTIGTNEAADSFDMWNDFTGSVSTQYSSNIVSNSEVIGQTGTFEWAKDPNDTKTSESAHDSSRKIDWMQDHWQGNNDKATGIVASSEVADSFDEWNDFAGSAVAQNPSSSISNSEINGQTGKSKSAADLSEIKMEEGANKSSVESFAWMQDDQQWQVSHNKTDTVATDDVADSFDVFNDFSSLATMQEKQTSNLASAEQTSEKNFLSPTNNSPNLDFGGFSQPDLFSGQFSDTLSSTAATNTQAAAASASSNSVADVDAAKGNSISKPGSKFDVETLMSQMHDLSFMLEGNLSIPPK